MIIKDIRDNLFITIAALVVAGAIGFLLLKSRENHALKIERAIVATGNAALDRGYACGAAKRDIEECRAEMWHRGTAPLRVYGAIR